MFHELDGLPSKAFLREVVPVLAGGGQERGRREQSLERQLAELAELLRLEQAPRRIECYDTSHLRGALHVASRVVFP